MSCLMAASIVSDRDPVATSSLASLIMDDLWRLTVTGLSGNVFLLDADGRQQVMSNRVETAEEVGVARLTR